MDEEETSQPSQYEVNKRSMMSKQYPYEVNVLRKRVNQIRKSGQTFPDEQVNLFRMDRQMLNNQG
jgi:hypothetical protein